jgi:hypothetical protein
MTCFPCQSTSIEHFYVSFYLAELEQDRRDLPVVENSNFPARPSPADTFESRCREEKQILDRAKFY